MSYTEERDRFIARMTGEGLGIGEIRALLRGATTLQRYAELACSSEAADRDRVECPAAATDRRGRARKPTGACLCDQPNNGHEMVTRIAVQGDRLERRLRLMLNGFSMRVRQPGEPEDMRGKWEIDTQGDPRGYALRVIPPSYQERNKGRDRFNRDNIGVPARDSRLRF